MKAKLTWIKIEVENRMGKTSYFDYAKHGNVVLLRDPARNKDHMSLTNMVENVIQAVSARPKISTNIDRPTRYIEYSKHEGVEYFDWVWIENERATWKRASDEELRELGLI
jgi:hypothetical protein